MRGPLPITANTKVASGTRLYARVKGDAIGYIVGDRDVDLAAVERGWFALTIDSPWGPVAFAARVRTGGFGAAVDDRHGVAEHPVNP